MGALDAAIRDLILLNAIDLTRLEANERQKVIEIMKRLEKDLTALLATEALSSLGRSAANVILEDAKIINLANGIIKGAYIDAQTAATETLAGLAEVEVKATAQAVESALKISVGSDLPTATYLEKLASNILIDGAPTKAWWSRQAGDVAFRFAAEVRKGKIAGETGQQIVSRIVGKDGQPGIMPIARKNATALVHTSIQTVASAARMESYKALDDVIKGFRWNATLDSHTCEMCAVRDGQAWDKEGNGMDGNDLPYAEPPLHWNCRCVLLPVLKTYAEQGIDLPEIPRNGQRASTNGPVPAKMTFADWFRTRSAAQQNEQFGKGKAELFRQGKISLRDMLDQSGNPLTLEELRAKYE